MSGKLRRIRDALAFLLGGVIGGAGLVALGVIALLQGGSGAVENVAFFVSLAALLGSFAAPTALVRYLSRNWSDGLGKFTARVLALVANVAFLFLIGVAWRFVVTPRTDSPAVGMIVFLDGVFGFVWGGILASVLVRRWLD